MKRFVLAGLLSLCALPAAADTFAPVRDQATFLSLVEGKELRNRLYGVRVTVEGNGNISGSAVGWDVTGSWSWQDGYFCRDLAWGGDPLGYNCQLVEAAGDEIRFTVDRGAGDSASFRIE